MFCFCHVCQNITPGMKLWGAVAEVNEKDLVVSLPGGLRGLVNASDVVDPIFDNKIEVHITLFFFIFLRSPCCFTSQCPCILCTNGSTLFSSYSWLLLFSHHFLLTSVSVSLSLSRGCTRVGKASFLVYFVLGSWFVVLC